MENVKNNFVSVCMNVYISHLVLFLSNKISLKLWLCGYNSTDALCRQKELHRNGIWCFEQILESALHKTSIVQQLTSYQVNPLSKRNKTCVPLWHQRNYSTPLLSCGGNKLINLKTLLNNTNVYLLLDSKWLLGERKRVLKHETCWYCYMDALHGRWLNGWRKSLTATTQECCEQFWTSPGGNTPQSSSCTATYLQSQKTIKVRWTSHAEHCWRSRDELRSDVLLWTLFA